MIGKELWGICYGGEIGLLLLLHTWTLDRKLIKQDELKSVKQRACDGQLYETLAEIDGSFLITYKENLKDILKMHPEYPMSIFGIGLMEFSKGVSREAE